MHFAGTSQDRQGLASRLEAAGCPVQRGGTDWLGSGDFEGALKLPHRRRLKSTRRRCQSACQRVALLDTGYSLQRTVCWVGG